MIIRGIKFPFSFSNGSVTTSDDDIHLGESIIQIIGTGRGEYLLKPDFGSRLQQRVFDPVNIAALVAIDIRDAISKYEPRIRLIETKANLDESADGIVKLIIGYIPKGKTEISNISFAFRS